MVRILDYGVKFGGALALLLGLALWSGTFYSLVPLHAGLGLIVVLSLWGLALAAFRRRVSVGLAAGAALWGVVTVGVGFGQTQMLVGASHWLVQVLHLLIGLGAIAIGAVLARKLRQVPAE